MNKLIKIGKIRCLECIHLDSKKNITQMSDMNNSETNSTELHHLRDLYHLFIKCFYVLVATCVCYIAKCSPSLVIINTK